MIKKIKRILKDQPSYYIPMTILIILIIVALIAPLLPFSPTKTDISKRLLDPSREHFFGTDDVGRDYFIRVLYGGRVSLLVGILAMIVSTFVGTTVGLISGYYGGRLDSILMRMVDVLSSIPSLILTIVLSVYLEAGLTSIVIIIGLFTWMGTSRLIRAETLSVKERDFVKYAKFIKKKDIVIMIKHIIPQIFPTIIIASVSSVASAIMMESSLSFLGLGIQQPLASWGSLLQNGQSNLQNSPHMAIIPGVFIILTIFSVNQIGNLLRDANDLGGD